MILAFVFEIGRLVGAFTKQRKGPPGFSKVHPSLVGNVRWFGRNAARVRAFGDALSDVTKKYGLPRKYSYLPNQSWWHKNHEAIVDASVIPKKRNLEVVVGATGSTEDAANRTTSGVS